MSEARGERSRSREAMARASRVLPGGVNSPVARTGASAATPS